ncbi:MAG: AmmeMemoRadiSam system protein B [Bacteroidales bacterium]
MKRKIIYLILIMAMFGSIFSGKAQHGTTLKDREPCVAGQFYSGTAPELRAELKDMFARAKPRATANTVAIISPHAGYIFSGDVAASAFNQVDPEKAYHHIFLIGSSHRTYFDGASIYNAGNYKTPLGTVDVDIDLANKLMAEHEVFSYRNDAHASEHSLEVQVPFLQYHLKKDFRIIPIVIATQSEETVSKIADALRPYFNDRNLFVISSDFSHYPPYSQANEVDKATAEAIASNSVEIFINALKDNEQQKIPNLATSMCGWSSMLMLLNLTEGRAEIDYELIEYKNSGDQSYGDKGRVVGYWAIAVQKKKSEAGRDFSLTEAEQNKLLAIARQTITGWITQKEFPLIDTQALTPVLLKPAGAFVSLHSEGKLRGCIGRFDAQEPLYKVVQDMAVAAATSDSRFLPVTAEELNEFDVEISVLTPMIMIDTISQIELGRHGIYIKQGYCSGTFLPQVAINTGWTLEELLGHCARDKARIGWDGWKTAEIYTYEAIVFGEKKTH